MNCKSQLQLIHHNQFSSTEPDPEVPSAFCTSIQSSLFAGNFAGACACTCELAPCEWDFVFTEPTPDASPIQTRIAAAGVPLVCTIETSSTALGAIEPFTVTLNVLPASVMVSTCSEVHVEPLSSLFSTTGAGGFTSGVGGVFCGSSPHPMSERHKVMIEMIVVLRTRICSRVVCRHVPKYQREASGNDDEIEYCRSK